MAQAKLTVSDAQERVLGLLVHLTPTKYPILYDAKSGVNLRKTKSGESIVVPDGANLLNLKKLQTIGCFSVIEGTVLARLAAFSSITLNNTNLTMNFTAPVTSPQLTATAEGNLTDDVIVLVNGKAVAATFNAINKGTSTRATIAATTEDVSIRLTQNGASKIFDANNSAVAPATRTTSPAPILSSLTFAGTSVTLNFNEKIYTAGLAATEAGDAAVDDIVLTVDGTAKAAAIAAIDKANATDKITIDLGSVPSEISVLITPVGAAKILDTDDTAMTGQVTLSYTLSTEAEILMFTIPNQVGTSDIDPETMEVDFNMPFGTDVKALVPTIIISDKSTVSPQSEAAQDFTAPVTYTVTAEDGTTTGIYTVTCTVDPNTANDITAFTVATQVGESVIDTEAHTVTFHMANGTDVTALAPTITVSTNATANPASTVVQNFTAPIEYTVTSESGVAQIWTATCIVDPA